MNNGDAEIPNKKREINHKKQRFTNGDRKTNGFGITVDLLSSVHSGNSIKAKTEVQAQWEVNLDCTNNSHTFKPLIHKNHIFINADGFTKCFDLSGRRVFNTASGALNHIRPAIDGEDNIYTVGKESLTCIEPTGVIKWNVSHGTVSHTPLIDEEGIIYLCTREGFVVALNPDGSIYWKKKIKDLESIQPFIDREGYLHLTLYEGSQVIMHRKRGFFNPSIVKEVKGKMLLPVSSGYHNYLLYTVDNHDGVNYFCADIEGEKKWCVSLPEDTKSVYTLAANDHMILLSVRTDSLLLKSKTDEDGEISHRVKKSFLLALDYNGNTIFRVYADGEDKFSHYLDISSEGIIYITGDGDGNAGKLYAISPRGEVLWKQTDNIPMLRPKLNGTILITGGRHNPLKAFSAADGRYLWEKDIELAHGQSFQITSNGDIIAVDKYGRMIKIQPPEFAATSILDVKTACLPT